MSIETAICSGAVKPNPLKMIPVESSHVVAIGYSPGPDDKPGNCYVDFDSGVRYCYADVPAETWQQFLDTPSKGTFVMRVLRDTYKYFKVER